MAETINDAITLSLNESAVDKMKPEQFVTVAERPIGTTSMKWTLRAYKMESEYQLHLCLWVSNAVQASGTVSWGPKSRGMKSFEPRSISPGETSIVDCVRTSSLGEDGFVKCEVKFTPMNSTGAKLPSANLDEFFNDAPHFESDVDIVVGGERLKIHRSILSMMSPVFHSYFVHASLESKTGVIDITDFAFKTVKNVVDFAYGRGNGETPITEIIDMLKFADKYDIKTIMKLERVLETALNVETFCVVAQFAWDLDKQKLQTTCAQYYRKNVQLLTFRSDFVQLEAEVLKGIISAAALQPV